MPILRACALAASLTAAAACTPAGPANTATPARTDATTPTSSPSTTATPAVSAPTASLNPSLSDAGIVARVTIANDTAGGRDGTHTIIGVDGDGSSCSYTFEGDEFQAVAWYDDAADGQIHQFGVTVAADDIPDADGVSSDVTDGGVAFDFASDSGFGTLYVGNATEEDSGRATIDITRAGDSLTFDFEAASFNGATFSGTLVCAEATL